MSVFQTSPHPSRLVIASHRNRFVILRTNNSLPITPHPASRQRSYFQLQGLWFTLVRTCTLLVERLRGRTVPNVHVGNAYWNLIYKKILFIKITPTCIPTETVGTSLASLPVTYALKRMSPMSSSLNQKLQKHLIFRTSYTTK